jgi:3',5'-cyclic AMP phosphodiesterase CpdA
MQRPLALPKLDLEGIDDALDKIEQMEKEKERMLPQPKVKEVEEDEEDWYPGHPRLVRIVCVSDTHTNHKDLKMPPGDILVHAGDFSIKGRDNEIISFSKWLATLQYKHKIVVSGNHELTFDLEQESRIKADFGIR